MSREEIKAIIERQDNGEKERDLAEELQITPFALYQAVENYKSDPENVMFIFKYGEWLWY